MKRKLFALTTAAMLASGVAFAGGPAGIAHARVTPDGFVAVQYYDRWDDRTANINEREARLRNRIERGINDGRITRREAHQLFSELSSIEAKERAFRSDGRIGGREGAELNADLDRLADNVRHQLRDEQRRY
jgi:hypothetical protein